MDSQRRCLGAWHLPRQRPDRQGLRSAIPERGAFEKAEAALASVRPFVVSHQAQVDRFSPTLPLRSVPSHRNYRPRFTITDESQPSSSTIANPQDFSRRIILAFPRPSASLLQNSSFLSPPSGHPIAHPRLDPPLLGLHARDLAPPPRRARVPNRVRPAVCA